MSTQVSDDEQREINEMLERDKLADDLQAIFFPGKQYVLGKNHGMLWQAVELIHQHTATAVEKATAKYSNIIAALERAESHGNGLDYYRIEELLSELNHTSKETE